MTEQALYPRRGAALVVAAGGVVAALAALLVGPGLVGALGAVLATVLVVAFFATGALPLALLRGPGDAGLGFLVLAMTFVLRLVALFVVLALARRSDAVDVQWLAGTLIVLSLVWTAAHVWFATRRRLTLDI